MPIPKINDNLVERLEAKLKIKHNTARSYASNIRGLWRKLNKDKPFGGSLSFVPTRKMINVVAQITNLSARKNAANAAVAALKVIGGHDKEMAEYRQLMMGADKDFQAYLKAGKKKFPFKDGEKEWRKIRDLYKKVARVASAHNLWKRGEHIPYAGYRTLMALVYLKWLALVPVRRLEYTDSRFITAAGYRALTDEERQKGNWLVTGKKWTWELWNYKTIKTFGHQSLPIPLALKNTMRKIQPIAESKNAKGFIFLNSKWGPLNRNLFSIFIKEVFKKYLNKSYTHNTIRAIRVSSVWGKSVKTLDALELSENMGHSISTALLHYRKDPSDKVTDKDE
jgi:hypothetical protein